MDAVAQWLACSRDVGAVCRVYISPTHIVEPDTDDGYYTRISDVRDEHRAWPEGTRT